jgi:hypothetical protein
MRRNGFASAKPLFPLPSSLFLYSFLKSFFSSSIVIKGGLKNDSYIRRSVRMDSWTIEAWNKTGFKENGMDDGEA